MQCGRRARGETDWRCWCRDCRECQKTYRIVAANIVDDILADHPDLRWLWWLPVGKDHVGDLTSNWKRLR